jgi:hypothetical protein
VYAKTLAGSFEKLAEHEHIANRHNITPKAHKRTWLCGSATYRSKRCCLADDKQSKTKIQVSS